jgi:hypothetical protein
MRDALARLDAPEPPELTEAMAGDDESELHWQLGEAFLRSPRGIVLDWREEPSDALRAFARALRFGGAELHVEDGSEDFDADTDRATVRFTLTKDGRSRGGVVAQTADEGYRGIAAALATATGSRVLSVRPYEETDTFGFVALAPDDEEALRKTLGELFSKVFSNLNEPPSGVDFDEP